MRQYHWVNSRSYETENSAMRGISHGTALAILAAVGCNRNENACRNEIHAGGVQVNFPLEIGIRSQYSHQHSVGARNNSGMGGSSRGVQQ